MAQYIATNKEICVTLHLPEASSIHEKDEKEDQKETETHSEPLLCSQCPCLLQLVVVPTQTKIEIIIATIHGNKARFQVSCSTSFSSTVLTHSPRSLYTQQECKVC